jgi:hypothetical protein
MDSVLFWNEVALQAVANDHSVDQPQQGGPTFTSRALAIVHAAVFDANNSFSRNRKPYLTMEDPPAGGSVESAIAGAALAALLGLYSAQADFLQDSYEKFREEFGSIDQPSSDLGERIGRAVFDSRIQDGSEENRVASREKGLFANSFDKSNVQKTYSPGRLPGMHAVDPFSPDQGFHAPTWGNVRPFAVKNIHDLRSPAPPALSSAQYRADLKEVKSKGRIDSTTRTQEETYTGLFWAYDGANLIGTPPRLYNQIAREIAKQQNFSQDENARYFALINLAMGDAAIQCWDAKYFYNLWRPVVGIQQDLGPDKDPGWRPLGSPRSNENDDRGDFTPNFPAYTSGHATFGAASMTMMKFFLGEKGIDSATLQVKDFVSDELNGITTDSNGVTRPKIARTFTLDEGIQQNLDSRIFLGVHWRFDGTLGKEAGESIAKEVFERVATPA